MLVLADKLDRPLDYSYYLAPTLNPRLEARPTGEVGLSHERHCRINDILPSRAAAWGLTPAWERRVRDVALELGGRGGRRSIRSGGSRSDRECVGLLK